VQRPPYPSRPGLLARGAPRLVGSSHTRMQAEINR
jgi:hypothetical protein